MYFTWNCLCRISCMTHSGDCRRNRQKEREGEKMREGIPVVKRQQSGPGAVETQPRLINMEELVQMKKGTSCVRGGVFPLPLHQQEIVSWNYLRESER